MLTKGQRRRLSLSVSLTHGPVVKRNHQALGSLGWLFAASSIALVSVADGGCKSNAADPAARICTPGNYVFCRCEDRSEGTKLCLADGASFEDCKCDGTEPPVTMDGGFNEIDSSTSDPDAGDAGAPNDTACIGKLFLVGGNAGGLYAASYKGAGKFTVVSQSGAGASIKGAPAIVPLAAGGFGAVYRDATDALYSTSFTSATFATPTRIGAVTASDAPSLAAVSGDLHMLYRGADGLHYHGTFTKGAWDDATSPVTSAGAHSFGPSSPTAALPAGDVLTIAYAGADQMLYRQTFATGWTDAVAQTGATISTVRPQIISLTGGTHDLLIVYSSAGDYKLRSATRDAGTKAWSTPILLDPNAYTTDAISLAPMKGGRAMLIYRGANLKPYFSVYDPLASAAAPWSVLAELVTAANPTVASSPSVAMGACGEDAVAVFAQDNGAVAIQRFVAGAWTPPAAIPGLLNFTDVGVGEHL
jgi:hypothetical protein